MARVEALRDAADKKETGVFSSRALHFPKLPNDLDRLDLVKISNFSICGNLWKISFCVVCYTAVVSVVTQVDDTKNGRVADYILCPKNTFFGNFENRHALRALMRVWGARVNKNLAALGDRLQFKEQRLNLNETKWDYCNTGVEVCIKASYTFLFIDGYLVQGPPGTYWAKRASIHVTLRMIRVSIVKTKKGLSKANSKSTFWRGNFYVFLLHSRFIHLKLTFIHTILTVYKLPRGTCRSVAWRRWQEGDRRVFLVRPAFLKTSEWGPELFACKVLFHTILGRLWKEDQHTTRSCKIFQFFYLGKFIKNLILLDWSRKLRVDTKNGCMCSRLHFVPLKYFFGSFEKRHALRAFRRFGGHEWTRIWQL